MARTEGAKDKGKRVYHSGMVRRSSGGNIAACLNCGETHREGRNGMSNNDFTLKHHAMHAAEKINKSRNLTD